MYVHSQTVHLAALMSVPVYKVINTKINLAKLYPELGVFCAIQQETKWEFSAAAGAHF